MSPKEHRGGNKEFCACRLFVGHVAGNLSKCNNQIYAVQQTSLMPPPGQQIHTEQPHTTRSNFSDLYMFEDLSIIFKKGIGKGEHM